MSLKLQQRPCIKPIVEFDPYMKAGLVIGIAVMLNGLYSQATDIDEIQAL